MYECHSAGAPGPLPPRRRAEKQSGEPGVVERVVGSLAHGVQQGYRCLPPPLVIHVPRPVVGVTMPMGSHKATAVYPRLWRYMCPVRWWLSLAHGIQYGSRGPGGMYLNEGNVQDEGKCTSPVKAPSKKVLSKLCQKPFSPKSKMSPWVPLIAPFSEGITLVHSFRPLGRLPKFMYPWSGISGFRG